MEPNLQKPPGVKFAAILGVIASTIWPAMKITYEILIAGEIAGVIAGAIFIAGQIAGVIAGAIFIAG